MTSSARDHVTSCARDHVTSSARDHVTSCARDHVTCIARDHVTSCARDHVTCIARDHVTSCARDHVTCSARDRCQIVLMKTRYHCRKRTDKSHKSKLKRRSPYYRTQKDAPAPSVSIDDAYQGLQGSNVDYVGYAVLAM